MTASYFEGCLRISFGENQVNRIRARTRLKEGTLGPLKYFEDTLRSFESFEDTLRYLKKKNLRVLR